MPPAQPMDWKAAALRTSNIPIAAPTAIVIASPYLSPGQHILTLEDVLSTIGGCQTNTYTLIVR